MSGGGSTPPPVREMKQNIIISILILAGAVSCQDKTVPDFPGSMMPISVSASGGANTRSIVDTTVLPNDYTILMSAYLTDKAKPANTRNYFTGVPFHYNTADSLWHGTPAQYWSYSGEMDFLALASEMDLSSSVCWGDTHNTDGLTVDVPENFDGASEVLYSIVDPRSYSGTAMDMTFMHTQAVLEFNFQSKCDDLIFLDSLIVHDAYTGGRLYVQQHPLHILKWDVDDLDARDVPVPSVDVLTPLNKSKVVSFSVAILPKEQRHFTVWFRQRANTAYDVETMAVPILFEYFEPSVKWKMGRKYTYNFTLDPKEITLTVETSNMDTGNGTIIEIN